MLVVLAAPNDHAARDLVARWSASDAHLVTPAGLSRVGWRHSVANDGLESHAVIDGQVVGRDAIRGVLNRLPCVVGDDLPHIIDEDRDYVAAEMTAFLLAWLAVLPAPVLNRPVDGSLAGPTWRRERWLRLATRLGIPIQKHERSASLGTDLPSDSGASDDASVVTVIGESAFGDVDARLLGWAHELASAARAGMLAVYFSGSDAGAVLLSADVWTNVRSPLVADAILGYFDTRSVAC